MSSLQDKDQHQQEALEQAEADFWNTANNKLIRYGGKWTHKIIVEAEGTVMKVRWTDFESTTRLILRSHRTSVTTVFSTGPRAR